MVTGAGGIYFFGRSFFLKWLPVFLFALLYNQAAGAHLVGGSISYTCLGGNNYQVTLRIYRDCNSGGALFDDTAAIAVYDMNNNLVTQLNPAHGAIIPVSSDSTGNPCVSAPPNLCTEYTEYVAQVNLPPVPGGYVLTHQRCCRNSSISNVFNPGAYGNTYTISIPSNDTVCNSSPAFNSVAPIVICLNKSLDLPITVSEPDGDSLYYELCDILQGGSSGGGGGCLSVIPNPPCPPPYNSIPFLAPFTSASPLPASPAFTIDSQTGQLSGTPNLIGQFVVGICVHEYRNGVELSTTRLDYQFNVTNCISNVVSDMITPAEDPTILCDGLTVHFTSESVNASDLLWDFGDPSTTADTSSAVSPAYTYPQPGNYKVTLIASPGVPCSDTLAVNFNVKYPVEPLFSFDGVFCFEAQDVNFHAIGNYPANATFGWDFGADGNPQFSTLKEPSNISWSTPGKHYVALTVTTGVCEWELLDSVQISNLSVAVDAGPDQIVNREEEITVSGSGGTQYYWFSDYPMDFGARFSQTSTARLQTPEDTITVYLKVYDPLGCEGLDSLKIYVNEGAPPINFFTPNGDGINDVFDISSVNPDNDCRLVILNRWGSEVYWEDNYDNNWSGVDRGGKELPDGTYYYILQCGSEIRWKDAVTIMRYNK